jgi:hypothetical protein
MDTPDVPEMNTNRARRRSSGLEVFNVCHIPQSEGMECSDDPQEAKTLQSTSNFLNGLSTSRRRAETATEPQPEDPSPPATLRPNTAVTQIASNDTADHHHENGFRQQGLCFKSSGFSYSRPLKPLQLNCYRDHNRLLASRNNCASVECAVCHADSDAVHWSCSWCALRMCGDCRKDFSTNGLPALNERIKRANIGLVSSLNQSVDSGLALVETA